MKMKTILYVEDDQLDVGLTIEVLKEKNMANPIVSVSDGVEALKYLSCEGIYKGRKSGNPCMILLDMNMPNMGGLEFLSIVKKDIRFKRIPVIMFTSSREDRDLIKGYDLGVHAYIEKPFKFDGFTDLMKRIGVFWVIVDELPSE